MTNPTAPEPTVNLEAVRKHFRTALRYPTPTALWTALADIPVLLAELDRTRALLTRARLDTANLLAAAKATLGAAEDREPDALDYLRDEAERHEPIAPPDEPTEHDSGPIGAER